MIEIREYLRKFGKENEIKVIDWSSYLDKHRKNKKTMFAGLEYYHDHTHMSSEGNRAIANLIYNEIYSMNNY